MGPKTYSLPKGQKELDQDKLERIRKAFKDMSTTVQTDTAIQSQISNTVRTIEGISEYHRTKPEVLGSGASSAARSGAAGVKKPVATEDD